MKVPQDYIPDSHSVLHNDPFSLFDSIMKGQNSQAIRRAKDQLRKQCETQLNTMSFSKIAKYGRTMVMAQTWQTTRSILKSVSEPLNLLEIKQEIIALNTMDANKRAHIQSFDNSYGDMIARISRREENTNEQY